ncbi:MAG: catalase [Cypionkella sp.]|nr:catalase [Cypionkella sp.]
MQPAIPYSAHVETAAPDEAETIQGLKGALTEILETTSAHYGHAVRSVHAKSHGLIAATLEVLPDLPEELAQGVFANPGLFQAVLRISTNPGDLLPDSISLPRGIALKVIGVEGDRLEDSPGGSQDFIMVNGPVFAAKDPESFLKNLKLLAKTTDRATWAKVALSSVLRGTEKALEAVGGESGILKALGGAPNVHPLGETYYSQTAFRHGDYVAKYQLVPASPNLTRLTGAEIDPGDDPDAIRKQVDIAMMGGGTWDFRVQLRRDAKNMPVEDATVQWSEEISPFQTVARLHAAPQRGWTDARAALVDDSMRFTVWTGLEAHRPLGAINRVRKPVYDMSSAFREQFNHCPIHEPTAIVLPEGA